MLFSDGKDVEYARWIKSFQRKDHNSISFSDDLSAINRAGGVRVKSLNPLEIETDAISSDDFKQLGLSSVA